MRWGPQARDREIISLIVDIILSSLLIFVVIQYDYSSWIFDTPCRTKIRHCTQSMTDFFVFIWNMQKGNAVVPVLHCEHPWRHRRFRQILQHTRWRGVHSRQNCSHPAVQQRILLRNYLLRRWCRYNSCPGKPEYVRADRWKR